MESSLFAKRLKEVRVAKGFTQEYLSQQIDISRPAYSNYETGFREPSIQIIDKLADALDVSVDWLFGRTDIQKPYPKK